MVDDALTTPGTSGSDRYRGLVERVPAVVFELTNDPELHIRYTSPATEQLTGYDVETWKTDRDLWRRVIFADDRARVLAAWDASVEQGAIFDEEYRFVRRDGTLAWVRETIYPLGDHAGAISAWQGLMFDISDQRLAEEAATSSEARYRDLLERLPAVVYVDSPEPEPRSLYLSPNSTEILGHSPGDYRRDPSLWKRVIHPDDLERVAASWRAAVQQGSPFAEEYRLRRSDGTIVWINDSSVPIRDDEGTLVHWQGVMADVTAQKEVEEEFKASERRYRSLVEQLPVIVYLDTGAPTTETAYVSPNVLEILGHPASWFIEDASRWYEILHPDDRERVIDTWRSGWRTGVGYRQEFRFVRSDGSTIWVRDSADVVSEPEHGLPAWQGVLVDITGQKLAEQEKQSADRRYRALVEQVPAIVYEMGPDDERHTLYVSPHVEEILGYSRKEWLDQPDIWMELLDEEDRETQLAAHDLHNETGERWDREYRLIAHDGRRVWVRDRATLVEDPSTGEARWYGVMLDITARKDAEEALQLMNEDLEFRVLTRTAELEEANEMLTLEIGERRRAEEALRLAQRRYRELVEDLPAVVYAWETNWEDREEQLDEPIPLPYMSPKIEDMVGYTAQEWQQIDFWKQRLHPHDREWVCELADRCVRTGEPFTAEYRYLAKDGRVVWVLDRASLRARDHRGFPAHYQGVMLDITAQKLAEAKADEAEERYRELTERGPVASYVIRRTPASDQLLEVEYVSPQVSTLVGLPIDRLLSDPQAWTELIHPDDRERVGQAVRECLETGQSWAHEYRMIRADGAVIWIRNQANLIGRDREGRPSRFLGAIVDVTDERQATAEIAASEQTFRGVVEGMPGIPWSQVVDPETGVERYTYIGPQCLEITGYTAAELLAEPKHFTRLVHPEDQAVVDAARARSLEVGIWKVAFRVIRRDGSIRNLRGLAQRTVTDDGLHVWNGVTVDETDELVRLEGEAPAHARADTEAVSPASSPSRLPAGGSPAGR